MLIMRNNRYSRRVILTAACILIAVLIITVLMQYGVYRKERNILLFSEFRIRKELRRATKVKEGNLKEFADERLEAGRMLKELEAILPTEIGVESFLEQFASFAKELNVDVHNAHSVVKRRDFYAEALLSMTLHGDEKDVRALIGKQLEEKRLTSWKTFREDEKSFPIELIIYSIKQRKPKKIDVDKIMCPEFESNVWLWPFKGRIEKYHRELDYLCDEARDHFEILQLFKELADKRRYLLPALRILKHLQENRTLPSFAD